MIVVKEDYPVDVCGQIAWSKREVHLTGRWKVVVINGEPRLWFEVKRAFWFKEWVPEGRLNIEAIEEFVNDCKGAG